jgi:hypothetical protein
MKKLIGGTGVSSLLLSPIEIYKVSDYTAIGLSYEPYISF